MSAGQSVGEEVVVHAMPSRLPLLVVSGHSGPPEKSPKADPGEVLFLPIALLG